MASKVMGSIKGPYLWFPDSYGFCFANEHAEYRRTHYTRGYGMSILRDAQDSAGQGLPLIKLWS